MNDYIIDKQVKWHSGSNQGCLFAAALMKIDPIKGKVNRHCLDKVLSKELFEEIKSIINKQILNQDCYILSLILPQIIDYEGLVSFIEYSKIYTDWLILDKDISLDNGHKVIRIRVPLGEQDETGQEIYAWMIGFAPLAFLAPTRQSPYFEIMIITKSKKFLKEKYNKYSYTQHLEDSVDRGGELQDAHLADVYIEGYTDCPYKDNAFWGYSSLRKWSILKKKNHDYDSDAKAKVTFSLPV